MKGKSTVIAVKKRPDHDYTRQVQVLRIIAETQEKYLTCHSIEEIYHIATEKIHDIVSEGYTVTTTLDEQVQAMRFVSYSGFGGLIQRIQRILHIDPRKMNYPLKDMPESDLKVFRSGKLETYSRGIYGLMLEKVPHSLCNMVEDYLGVKHIYTMGYVHKGLHFGGLIILSKYDLREIKWAIEMLVNQAAIVINQIRSENSLKQSEEFYRSLFENLINGFAYCQMIYKNGKPVDYIYRSVNKSFVTQTKLRNVEGKKVSEVIPGIKRSTPQLFEILGRVAMTGNPERFEIYIDTLKMWFYISAYSPQKEYFVAIFDVITERKMAEERIIHINSVLRALREVNQLITHEKDRNNLIKKACNLLIETRGFDLAWILLLDNEMKSDLAVVSSQNKDIAAVVLKQLNEGKYPACVNKILKTTDNFSLCDTSECIPVKFSIEGRGLVNRLEYENKIYGIIAVFLRGDMALDQEEQSLFRELTNDLSFAMSGIEAEERRKQISEALRIAEERYRTTLDNMLEGCQIIDFEWRYLFLNKAVIKQSKKTAKELLGRTMMEMYPGFESTETFGLLKDCMYKRESHFVENEFTFPDGSKGWFELRIEPVPEGIFILSSDITEKKLAEKALKVSEEQYRLLIETANEGIVVSQDEHFKFTNRRMSEILGYSREELLDMPFLTTIHPDDREDIKERHDRRLKGEKFPGTFTIRVKDKNGNTKWVELNVALINWSDRPATLTFVNEITERKIAEEALKKSTERFQRISSITSDIAFSCIKSRDGDYAIDWISGATEKIVGYSLDEIQERTCWRFLVIEDDIPLFEKNVTGLLPGQSGTCDLRLTHKDGDTVWVTSYAECVVEPDNQELCYLYGGLVDITERKKLEIKIQNNLNKLGNTVEGAINTISLIAETRDPYTAGHQKNVTKIACAIAEELGLTEDKIETVRVAAMLHDIGKIQIPAEILSKPTRLTDVEMQLVRSHPSVGYEILNTIDLPWSVAPIVLQHHERLNGTGYPNRLTGEKIMFESKILSVADVVEAMASHRPYRPSMGIENALQEIIANKGILYDETIVDACVRLFREKNFKF